MKRITVLSSSILIVTGFHVALAQPPGGGRGGFTPPTFDSMNTADADGNKDDYLTLEEVEAWFAERFAGRGGGGEFNAKTVFAQWDTLPEGAPDGKITKEEFDARPVGPGRGRAGPGGGAPPR